MNDIRDFLQRPLVQMGVGAIILLFAISWFSAGGSGVIIGLLLTVAGGHSVWRGFTRWQAKRS
jgi:hypothetical protein